MLKNCHIKHQRLEASQIVDKFYEIGDILDGIEGPII